ncbi:MAG: glycosyltransferase [Xenococcaceae cyanobacterium MO_207.B15]|nr:glycosyltransferase [Xenococcaceae cyanobacterium MO_207.B15]
MKPLLSVIIPTHNPNRERLNRVLEALKEQDLECKNWELILVDNNSSNISYLPSFDLTWHPQGKLITEENLGLTWARIAGIQASIGDYLVFVDDDNILDRDYLREVIEIFQHNSKLGGIGGKSLPEFEVQPESWVEQFWTCLALRDLGEESLIYSYPQATTKQHPKFAPIGAGMALRKVAAKHYLNCILHNPERLALDRTGSSLRSGGDCDINLTILEGGWEVGYFPQLKLTHLMPSSRLTKKYLAKINRASFRSWIQVLNLHGIRPWQKIPRWTVWLRKIKAFCLYQPWQNSIAYIRWQGACGMFEGQADLPNLS